jgi:hypothetical protein
VLLPYIKKRIIDVDEDDMTLILNGYEDNHYVPLQHLNCQEILSQIECGSIVLRLKKSNFEFHVTGWLGAHTVSLKNFGSSRQCEIFMSPIIF